ncbi:MAG: hypothetical protein EBS73_11665 [Betaproteobacteria bacterium]|nr:hypothetical protein [Betaproteobacteria bacterium]NBS39906.1 hypothetical protein [Betaproteobacteria bacterium]
MGSRSIARIKASARQAASDSAATLAIAKAQANQRDHGSPSCDAWGGLPRDCPPPVPPPPPPPPPVPPLLLPPPPPAILPPALPPDPVPLPMALAARACWAASCRLRRGSRLGLRAIRVPLKGWSGGGSLGFAMLTFASEWGNYGLF